MPFPSSSQYVPVTLNGSLITDLPGNVSPSETDIVGNAAFPAAYFGYDGANVYFRLRLNSDPRLKNAFHNFSWGVLFDTNNSELTYEWVLAVNGNSNTVDLIGNLASAPDSFNDQAEGTDGRGSPDFSQAIINFDIARAQEADDGSGLAGGSGFFIDWFVPAATLFTLLGIIDRSILRFLFFTSTNSNNINKDAMGNGQTLSSAFSDPLTIESGDVRAQLIISQIIAGAPLTIIGGAQTTLPGTITVTNTGRSAASNIVVVAVFFFNKTISFDVTQTSKGSTAYNALQQSLTWNIGNLSVGETAELQYNAQGVFNVSGNRTLTTTTVTGTDLFTGAPLNVPVNTEAASIAALGSISGTVMDQVTGLPLSGVAVEALNTINGTAAAATTTDAAGVYSFPSLPPGDYALRFSYPLYQEQSAVATVTFESITTVNILLSPFPAAINGTVTSAESGGPIAGAAVRLTDSNGVLIIAAATNAVGQFSLTGIFPGSYRIIIEAASFQLKTQPLTLTAGETRSLNFQLESNPGSLAGTVTDPEGNPIAGALVEVLTSRASILATTTTDASGHYVINNLIPTNTDRLRLSAAQFVTQTIGLQINPDQTTIVNAILSPIAGSIAGVITDRITGIPLPGASISVSSEVGLTLQAARTNADGSYFVPSLSPGSYSVVITAPGYANKALGATVIADTVIPLSAALELLAGGVSGFVGDPEGTPLADIEIVAFLNNVIVTSVNSLENGTYTLGNLAPGNYTIAAAAEGFGGNSINVTVAPGQTSEAIIILIPLAGELFGRVTDLSGNPIAGATLSLQLNVDGGSLSFARIVTFPDGTYQFISLVPLPFIITASAAGFQNSYVGITIVPGQQSTANFQLAPNPGTILGTIETSDAEPIVGAGVQLRLNNASGVTVANLFTDTSGGFTASNLAPGTYAVVASAADFQTASATISVESGAVTAIRIELKPEPGSIEGTVIDALTGQPVSPSVVNVTDKNSLLLGSSLVGSTGQFRIDGLPPGSYTLTVTTLNYQGDTFGAIVQSNAITSADFALNPNPGTIIGVTLPAIGGIVMKLFNLNNVQIASSITQDDGTYIFFSLKSGSYYLTASAVGFSSQVIGVSVLPGETVTVALPLSPNPGRIVGTVLDISGNPIPGAAIKVLDGNESFRNVSQADSAGEYVVDLLPVGRNTAIASAVNFSTATLTVSIVPGETVSGVNFVLTPDPGAITGQVTDAVTGLPIGGADVEIRSGNASGLAVAFVTTDRFGNFLIDGLLPGSYAAIISADGYAASTVGAIVQSLQTTAAAAALAPSFGQVSGTIEDSSGNPLSASDTFIKLFTKEGALFENLFGNLDGTFLIDNLAAGEYILTVSSAGFMTASLGIIVSAGGVSLVKVVLSQATSALVGTVQNAQTGAVISGAQVNVNDIYGLVLDSTFSDENGNFILSGVPIGNLTVSASAASFGADSAGIVTEPGRTSQVRLMLSPSPGVVEGFVSDAVSGADLSGAFIQIFNASTGALIATVVSGSGGQYAFTNLAPGSYTANANAKGFTGGLGGFDIAPGQTTRFSFALDPLPGRLSGSVSNVVNGTPLSGSSIVVRQYNNFGPVASTILTDAGGSYDLGEVTPANYVVTAAREGFISEQSSIVVLAEEAAFLNFALTPASSSVSGTATDGESGSPLMDTMVKIVDGNGVIVGSGVTDDQGSYIIFNVPEGERTLIASNPERQTELAFIPTTQPTNQQFNVVLRGSPLTVRGTVTDNVLNAPVPGAIVSVLDPQANVVLITEITDGSGNFSATGLAPGTTYTLTVSAPNFGSAARSSLAAEGSGADGSLSLSAAFGTLTGTIRDTAGRPLYKALAEIITTEGELVRQIISNIQGRYTLTNLSAGEQIARFSFPGKQTKTLLPIIFDRQTTVLDVILLDEDEE